MCVCLVCMCVSVETKQFRKWVLHGPMVSPPLGNLCMVSPSLGNVEHGQSECPIVHYNLDFKYIHSHTLVNKEITIAIVARQF